jgi:hypothetical protein
MRNRLEIKIKYWREKDNSIGRWYKLIKGISEQLEHV